MKALENMVPLVSQEGGVLLNDVRAEDANAESGRGEGELRPCARLKPGRVRGSDGKANQWHRADA
jgi:hypothetical protein